MDSALSFCGKEVGSIREPDQRVNEAIRAREVRVISGEGEQLGIMSLHDALRLARERGLDLVEVAPQAKPPVCKMMDYSKWKYEQAKKLKEAKKRQKTQDVKEIKMRPAIDDHDFNVKARACERFLTDGDKVKAVIMFRGRELAHLDIGQKVLERLLERVKGICMVERPPKIEGRNMVMVLAPRQVQTTAKPEEQPAQEGK